MIHLCCVLYQEKKEGLVQRGLAVIEAPGLANILSLLDKEGYPVTASDGGSPSIWWYELLPTIFSCSVDVEYKP